MLSQEDNAAVSEFIARHIALQEDGEPADGYFVVKTGPRRSAVRTCGEAVDFESGDLRGELDARLALAFDRGKACVGIFAFRRGSTNPRERIWLENTDAPEEGELLSMPADASSKPSSAAEFGLLQISLHIAKQSQQKDELLMTMSERLAASGMERVKDQTRAAALESLLRSERRNRGQSDLAAVISEFGPMLAGVLLGGQGQRPQPTQGEPQSTAGALLTKIAADAKALFELLASEGPSALGEEERQRIKQVGEAAQILVRWEASHPEAPSS